MTGPTALGITLLLLVYTDYQRHREGDDSQNCEDECRNCRGSKTRALSRILVVVLAAVKNGGKVPNQWTQET